MSKCKVCKEETKILILIRNRDVPLCEKCCRDIFRHIALAVAEKKTVFDVQQRRVREPVETHPEIAAEVLNYLFHRLLKDKHRPEYDEENVPKAYLKDISARVNDGATVEELKAVCYFKWKDWKDDKDMRKFIRPQTLFVRKNFNNYLAEYGHKIPKMKAVTSDRQREIIKELNSYGVRAEINEETDRLAKELMSTGYQNKTFLNMYLIQKI
jgi:uncharacterized phage protein (TIGR02220 family)